VDSQHDPRLSGLAVEKALAIAAYGESVAAYRYRTLAEKTTSPPQRLIFQEMADEEQGHHVLIEKQLATHFPGSDFVLTAADKDLVIVGPRMLEVNDERSFAETLRMIYESELRTGRFYAALHSTCKRPDLEPLLKEMADECFEHAERIKAMVPRTGNSS